MGVTFQPEPIQLGDGTWDFHDGAAQLHVSETNARLILDRLGFTHPEDVWGGSIDADDLIGRALTGNVGRDDSGAPSTDTTVPGCARFIDCGTRPGYFEDRLGALVDVAQAAKDLGVAVQWA